MVQIVLMDGDDLDLLETAPTDLFDGPLIPSRAKEFLGDPRHHIAVAEDQDTLVGFATAIHYVHPDKDPELWIAEVGVAEDHGRGGIAKALIGRLLALASELGCTEAWVLTEQTNAAAIRLYESIGGHREDDPVMFSIRTSNPANQAP